MKHLIFLSLLIGVLGCTHGDAVSQPNTACPLIAWQRSLPPHTERTPETYPPLLRDTLVKIPLGNFKVSLPEGFTIRVFTTLSHARNVVLSPDSVIYATNGAEIYAYPDHNHDGIPDSTIKVYSGLGNGFGIGFYQGNIYFSEESALYRGVDQNHDRKVESVEKIYALSGGGNHRTRNFVIDTTTGDIFIQVGSVSNDNEDNLTDSTRATVMAGNLHGRPLHVYARGLRNAVGMDFDPRTGALWVDQNGSDNMFSSTIRTDNNPSEGIFIVCEGAHYGWPYAYGYQMCNPKYLNKDTAFIQSLSGPVAEVLAHEAPLGLHFYRGSNFPTIYRNAIFQGYHGSWNRSRPAPPRVTVMWADSDGRNAHVQDFVNGFQPDSSSTRWGRTVGVTEDAAGALYVADDQAGVIYQITYTGTTQAVKQETVSSAIHIRQIVPSPARSAIRVDVSLPTARSVAYEIVDLLGRVVNASSTLPLSAGAQTIDIALPSLTAGTYVLRIIGHEATVSKQFVVE